jgi:iron complex outermembrane recepter protein
VDLVFSGQTPLTLPGGNVSLALGSQWRQLQAKVTVPSDFYNGTTQCPNPGTTGATVPDGPDAGTDPDVVPVTQTPRLPGDPLFTGCGPLPETPFLFLSPVAERDNDRQQYSLFLEAQIPVLENLNFQAAVRREAFSGGLEETVYKIAGKWDVWGPLSIRGSYGTNYQAPAVNLVPGEVNNAVGSISRAGNSFRGTSTLTRSDIVPETATVSNIGVIWQSEGVTADHDFRFIADFFSIETEDEFALLASFNQIANAVITLPSATPGGSLLANCAHPLAPRILFNQGTCVQGVSTGNDIAVVSSEFGNGPSQTTEGIDFQIGYSLPVGPGDLSFDATGTYLTELKSAASLIDGRANGDPNGAIVPVTVSSEEERIGERNVDAGVGAAPEWRANASINYRLDRHNFRFGVNYVSGVDDERGPVRVIGGGPTEFTDYGVKGDDWLTFDFTYLFDITDSLRLTATVDNILDKDPPAARQEFGYDPFIADPLGRTFEISIKKTF